MQCKQFAGDKVCDNQCNNHECQWDGGDCSLNWRQPWLDCTGGVPCWNLFKNGQCDKECNNAGCLFDGFECQETQVASCKYVTLLFFFHCSYCCDAQIHFKVNQQTLILLALCFFRYSEYCADHYGDKNCDQSCNTEACGWDGLDCSIDTPAKIADGTLVIVVLLQPEELLGDLKGFLRSLGALLHTNLRVKLDKNTKPMVYPYYKEQEERGRPDQSGRSRRELEKEVIG